MDRRVGGDYAGIYQSPRSRSLSTVRTDFLMDIGKMPRTSEYFARLPERRKKSKEMSDQMMKSMSKNKAPSKPKGPSAAEIALAKRKAEGQAARKKFEKEKGERRIALRKRYMKLLKLA